jgi:monoamine oxidase
MDQIAQAFAQHVAPLMINPAEVTAIRKTGDGVRLIYRHSGKETALDADFAICTLPLSVLNTLESDFSPTYQSAIAQGAQSYIRAVKHGFQANRRFWEENEQIYGGISWTSNNITQIWYPSAGFGETTGILVGAYIWENDIADRVAAMPPGQRLQAALKEGEALHRNYSQELSPEQGVSVAWGKIPYSLGGWISWEETARETAYRVLNVADGPIYLAGEHMSYLTGWQEGAVLSAHKVVREIARQVQEKST